MVDAAGIEPASCAAAQTTLVHTLGLALVELLPSQRRAMRLEKLAEMLAPRRLCFSGSPSQMTRLSGQLDSGSHGREAKRFEALRLKQRERSRCRLLFANRFKATRGVGCVRASSLSGNRIQICARRMAETAGFEPAGQINPAASLARRCFQPAQPRFQKNGATGRTRISVVRLTRTAPRFSATVACENGARCETRTRAARSH